MENFKKSPTTMMEPFPPLLLAQLLQQLQQTSRDGFISPPVGEELTVEVNYNDKGMVEDVTLLLDASQKLPVAAANALICKKIPILANTWSLNQAPLYRQIKTLCNQSASLFSDPELSRLLADLTRINLYYVNMVWKKILGLNRRLEGGMRPWKVDEKIMKMLCRTEAYNQMLGVMEAHSKMPKIMAKGSGSFGKVFSATWPGFGEVAVKSILLRSADCPAYIANEIEALEKVRDDDHFLHLHHAMMSSLESVLLVTELLRGEDGVDFFERLHKSGGTPPSILAAIARQLLLGLKVLHERRLAHLDLKPENIYINSDGRVKILDLGLAKRLDDPKHRNFKAGTPDYAPPELHDRGLQMNESSDVWSLGATMLFAFTGHVMEIYKPGRSAFSMLLAYRGELAKALQILDAKVTEFSGTESGMAQGLSAFIKDCLVIDQGGRAGINSLLSNQVIKEGAGDEEMRHWIASNSKNK